MSVKIKERYITRTIKRYSVKTLEIHLADNTVFEGYCYAPITVEQTDLLMYLKEKYDNESSVIAALKEVEIDEALYRLPESAFMAIGERVEKTETEQEVED